MHSFEVAVGHGANDARYGFIAVRDRLPDDVASEFCKKLHGPTVYIFESEFSWKYGSIQNMTELQVELAEPRDNLYQLFNIASALRDRLGDLYLGAAEVTLRENSAPITGDFTVFGQHDKGIVQPYKLPV